MHLKNRLLLVILFFSLIMMSCQKPDDATILNVGSYSKEQQALIDSSRLYLYTNPDKAIPFITKFKDLSLDKNQNGNVIMAYFSLGIAYNTKDDIDKCLQSFYRALSLCETSDCTISIKYTIAEVYKLRYNYEQALILLEESLKLAKKEKNIKHYNKIERAIALINREIGSPEKAVEILENTYKNVKKSNNIRIIRITRENLIEAYINNKNPDKALSLIEIGIVHSKSINNQESRYYLYKFQAEAYIQITKLKEAENAAKQALFNAQSVKNKQYILEASYLLALINKEQKRPENAINILVAELKVNQTKLPEILSKTYKLLAEANGIVGDNKMSSYYYEAYSKEEEKIKNKRFSTLNKTHALSLKELNNEKTEQEQKKWYWSIAFTILFCASVLIYINNKRIQKRNKRLFDDLMLKVDTYEKESIVKENAEIKIEEDEVSIISNKSNEEESSVYIIDDEKVNEILKKLKSLEDQHYFLRQDCTLHNMAKRLKTNTSYLSKVVNTHLNKTFSTYINELRINYAIIELKQNKQLRAYSTKAIAQELGYKKANSFSKYFKDATGITPAVYIKNIKELS